jgi:hypothetical protein
MPLVLKARLLQSSAPTFFDVTFESESVESESESASDMLTVKCKARDKMYQHVTRVGFQPTSRCPPRAVYDGFVDMELGNPR